MHMLYSARSDGTWSNVAPVVTPPHLTMRSSSRPAGRLATSASPTMVSLTSSSRSAGRGGSTAVRVSSLHPLTSSDTSKGGRVASDTSQRADNPACSVCSAGSCANDAAAVSLLHKPTSSPTRVGGRDASVPSFRSVLLARSTRSWLRCANDTPAGRLLDTIEPTLSSCSDGGRPAVRVLTTLVSLQSSDTSAVKCAKLARAVSLWHQRTFSVRNEVGRRQSSSSETLAHSCRSRRVMPASASTAPALKTSSFASLTLTAAGSAARHRTASTTGVAVSYHGTSATTPTTAVCSCRSARVSAVLRQERMAAAVTELPASTRTSSGTSSTDTGAAAAMLPALSGCPGSDGNKIRIPWSKRQNITAAALLLVFYTRARARVCVPRLRRHNCTCVSYQPVLHGMVIGSSSSSSSSSRRFSRW